jgi:cell pole-organizing protein PopZ
MSRPDLVQEPSMEEILASIRKIIAEEPAAERPLPSTTLKTSISLVGPATAAGHKPAFDTSAFTRAIAVSTTPAPEKAPDKQPEKQNGHAAHEEPAAAKSAPSFIPIVEPAPASTPASAEPEAAPQSASSSALDDLDDLLDSAPSAPASFARAEPKSTPPASTASEASPAASTSSAAPAAGFTRTTISPDAPAATTTVSAAPSSSKMIATSRAFLDAFPASSAEPSQPSQPEPIAVFVPPNPYQVSKIEPAAAPEAPAQEVQPEDIAAFLADENQFPAKFEVIAAPHETKAPVFDQPKAPAPEPVLLKAEPVADTAPAAKVYETSVSLSSTAPAAAADPRTMEDTVSELLRPMLRQWLSENMPKIIEKALLSELRDSQRNGS